MSDDDVTLREWRADDREALAALANDATIAANLRDAFPHPYGLADADRFLANARDGGLATFLAIESGGRLVGAIGWMRHADIERVSAEFGYWIGAPFRGRGLAPRAIRAMTRLAFARHPELHRLYATPYAPNAASARVLEKAGFRFEARLREAVIKNGVLLDLLVYALLRTELRD